MNEEIIVQPGDLVEFIEQKRVLTALCLSTRNHRSKLLTETSRLMTLSSPRFIHVTPRAIDISVDRKQQIEGLRSIASVRRSLENNVDLQDVWNKIPSRGTVESPGTLLEHAGIPFPESSQSDRESAFLRKVISTRCYFKLVQQRVYVFTEDEVLQALQKQKERDQEKLAVKQLAEWIRLTVSKAMQSETQCKSVDPNLKSRLIDALIADAAGLTDQPDKQWLKKIIKQTSLIPQKTSFQLLVELKHFSPDENLNLYKYGFPTHFSDEAEQELSCLPSVSPDAHRRDLTDLDCFTIDGSNTTDMDDALSIEQLTNSELRIGVHITDVSSLIHTDSMLDYEARERGLTLYLPDRTWHMFPDRFAEDLASLRESTNRPCISTFIHVDNTNKVISKEVISSIIHIRKRMTYDDVDQQINEPRFTALLKLAQKLRDDRISNGAVIMPRPEVNIDATQPGKMVFRKRQRQSPSQLIVSELMILSNGIAAELAAESGLPFPFRTQPRPTDPIPQNNNAFNPHIAYTQRRMMPRAETAISVKPHFSLGLNAYTNITSPLRRYFDVLAQRQLKAVLGLDEPYSRENLYILMKELEISVSKASAVTTHSRRYWFLKYLRALKGKTLDAIVLDRFPNRYQIWLEKFCMDADLPLVFGRKLLPEQRVKVVVEQVLPRDDVLKLRLLS